MKQEEGGPDFACTVFLSFLPVRVAKGRVPATVPAQRLLLCVAQQKFEGGRYLRYNRQECICVRMYACICVYVMCAFACVYICVCVCECVCV